MFLTVRHFHDLNALKSYGQNGPLKPNQFVLLDKTKGEIESALLKNQLENVNILTDVYTNRLIETSKMIAAALEHDGFIVNICDESRLRAMDQGDLILPDDYNDGDRFHPLDIAWDVICDESYKNKNLFYKFGDSLDGKYVELEQVFSRPGDSLGKSLINKYSLIYDLVHGKLNEKDKALILVTQSDFPLILMELQSLQNMEGITEINLPFKCREIYKSGLQDMMYDKSSVGDGNFDIPMGYVGYFDISDFADNCFDEKIKNAGLYLLNKQKEYEK